jgi:hypothetical protein
MTRLDELLKAIEYYDILKTPQKIPTITLLESQESPEKVTSAYTFKKANSPGKFLERNLIFLLAFIFMICVANLITTGILIYFFLENLH